MKMLPNETLDSWADRVQKYEHGHALMRIAQGEDVEKVLEDMSRRIVDKLRHSILAMIKDNSDKDFEKIVQDSRATYNEKMKHVGPSPDHVSDD